MKKRILVVEYDVHSVEVIREVLPPSLFEITTVDEGQKAKEILAKKSFDLVITAAMLPKFHGFNLAQLIAENFPQTKIIIISGIYKELEYKHLAVTQYHAQDFFEKPLKKEPIKNRVYELLEISSQTESANRSPQATMEFPIADTAKVPVMAPDRQEDSPQYSSDDLFGDIIQQVEAPSPPEKAPPHSPEKPPAKKPDASASDTSAKTRHIPNTDIDIPVPPKKPESSPASGIKTITSEDIDASLSQILVEDKKPSSTRKFKKIEDDFSKKFEDTLSGLGLTGKAKPHRSTPKKEPVSSPPSSSRTVEMPVQPPVPPRSPGRRSDELGDYDILGLIARGGMAEIYKAKKKGVKGFEKILAIKKILSGFGHDDKYIEMFVDEAKIAAELSHPNIVQIYDLGKKDDFYFIAMEYVQGKDLRFILKRMAEKEVRIPEELSLYIIIKVLEALNYAHSAKDGNGNDLNIVHRDISPPNILISYNGEVKLTDFGVSKAAIKIHQTLSGALKGKLLYMSPEQAKAAKDIDHRADLYAVGIILFELLTGQKLFLESSEMKVLKRVQNGQIFPPSQVIPEIDRDLENIILKSLETDRRNRFQNASEMINALESYLLAKFDHIPGFLHLAHFMTHLFNKEIEEKGIKISLKPLPYTIKRLEKHENFIQKPVDSQDSPIIENLSFEQTQPEPVTESENSIEIDFVESSEAPAASQPSDLQPEPEFEMDDMLPLIEDEAAESESADSPVQKAQDSLPTEAELLEPPLPQSRPEKEEPQPPETTVPPREEKSTSSPAAPAMPADQDFPETFEINLNEPEISDTEDGEKSAEADLFAREFKELEKESRKRSNIYLYLIAAVALIVLGISFYINRNASSLPDPEPEKNVAKEIAASEPEPAKTEKITQPLQQDDQEKSTQLMKTGENKTAESEKTGASVQASDSAKKPAAKSAVSQPLRTDRKTEKPPSPKTRTEPQKKNSGIKPKPAASTPPEAEIKKETEKKVVTDSSATEASEPEKSAVQPEEKTKEVTPAPPPPKPVVREGMIATQVDTKPVPVFTPAPKFSRKAKRKIKGTINVIISFLINHQGKVERIKFIRKSNIPELDMELANAIYNWQYKPAEKDGVKVKVWFTKPISIKR